MKKIIKGYSGIGGLHIFYGLAKTLSLCVWFIRCANFHNTWHLTRKLIWQVDFKTINVKNMPCFHKSTEIYKPQSVFFSISYFLIYYSLVKSLPKILKLKIFTLVLKVLIGQKINFSYYLRILSHKVRGKHTDVFMCYMASFYIINT